VNTHLVEDGRAAVYSEWGTTSQVQVCSFAQRVRKSVRHLGVRIVAKYSQAEILKVNYCVTVNELLVLPLVT